MSPQQNVWLCGAKEPHTINLFRQTLTTLLFFVLRHFTPKRYKDIPTHPKRAHKRTQPHSEYTNKKRIATMVTRFFHAHFPRTRRKRAFLLRGFLKSRNFPIFLQGVVIASLKMLEIHKGFLRFLPCTLLHLTKSLCISLFSEMPCKSQKGALS